MFDLKVFNIDDLEGLKGQLMYSISVESLFSYPEADVPYKQVRYVVGCFESDCPSSFNEVKEKIENLTDIRLEELFEQ